MVSLVSRASDVRISEINLSTVITSSSSAIACLPIISKQGATEPRHFSNAQDFIMEYGDPDPSVSPSVQAGLNFFTEGNDLWAIRAVGADNLTSSILLYQEGGITKAMGVGVADPLDTDLSTLVTGSQEAIVLLYASRGPGSYGDNLSIKVKSNTVGTPTGLEGTSDNTGGTLAAASYKYQIAAISSGGESLGSSPVTVVVSGITQATASITLTWAAVEGAIGYKLYGRVNDTTYGLIALVGGATTSYVDTGAISPDTLRLPITSAANAATSNSFVVSVWDNTNPYAKALEEWECTLTANIDSSGTQTQIEDRISPFSDYLQAVSNVSALATVPVITDVAKTALAGGDSGVAVTSTNVVNALQVFSNTQLYNVNILINAGMADPVLQLALDTLVQKRGDAVALLDTPSSKQKYQAAIDYRNLDLNLNSTYSALFCPDLLQVDLINGKQVYNPPSGWAAALCARTDRVANPAYSIAGLNRGLLNVLKSRYTYDDGQATALYNAQVNYTRTFVGQGIALWEQRTLAGQFSALSWLSVRRIVNVIKVSLYKFLLYALQEMNTDSVRRQLVNSCDSYLSAVKSADGIYDYSVVCDNTNNTPATANAGILVMTVVLIPNIPIHEVQLQVVISKQGVSFKETLSQVK